MKMTNLVTLAVSVFLLLIVSGCLSSNNEHPPIVQNLQSVTDIGHTTTDDINLLNIALTGGDVNAVCFEAGCKTRLDYNGITLEYIAQEKIVVVTTSATEFADTTTTDFNSGDYNQTRGTDNNVLLSNNTATTFFQSGDFTSRIFTPAQDQNLTSLTFNEGYHYGEQLPDEGVVQQDANMDGLVGLWHFNDTNADGSGVGDTSGNDNNGLLVNGADTNASGMFDTNGLFLDGDNDYVDMGHQNTYETQTFTISTWFKTTTSGFRYFASNYVSDADSWYIRINNVNTVTFHAASKKATSTKTVNDDEWHHAVGVKDEANDKLELYLDGIKVAETTESSLTFSTETFKVGTLWTGGGFFDGNIDEVAMFDRVLTQAEILDHYRRGVQRLKLQVRSCDDSSCAAGSSTSTDTSQADFDLGDKNQVASHSDGNLLLDTVDASTFYSSGDFNSQVFDAGSIANWDTMNFSEGFHYGEQLPDQDIVQIDANMQGLVGLWHFNDTNGGSGTGDTSGNDYNLELVGDSNTAINGIFDTNGLGLDGTGDWVQTPFADLNVFSASVWIKIPTISTWGGMVDFSNSLSQRRGPSINHTTTNVILNYGASKGRTSLGPHPFDGQWHHIVGTYDGTTPRLFIDANEMELGVEGGVGSATIAQNLYIGSINYGSPGGYDQAGHYDEVAIFNRVLSANEVLDHYRRGVQRLELQGRSCDDAGCDGEEFIGPDGTTSTFYSDGNVSWDLNSHSPNQFFQYRAIFETDDTNVDLFNSTSLRLLDNAIDFSPEVFVGPDGNTSTFFTDGNFTWDLNVMEKDINFFQYRAVFETDDTNLDKLGTTSLRLLDVNFVGGTETNTFRSEHVFKDSNVVIETTLIVGSPTGGTFARGTINAEGVYDDGVLLSDCVFDQYFDGNIKQKDREKGRCANRNSEENDFSIVPLKDLKNYIVRNRRLPNIYGRNFYEDNNSFASVGEMVTQLWETVEIQSIYITEMEERIKKLERR
ncbi:MAG: hypothetical protein CL528_13365 [Aequorivita sp.]|nr:hypothetical protein [Aequorivita sp.]|tara:strand:+ start:5717 stop:8680 length:2964 start_codon:yes stop_codon:yes gene_type:complete